MDTPHKFHLLARDPLAPTYPQWVLLGQFTTNEQRDDLQSRMGKLFREFKIEENLNA